MNASTFEKSTIELYFHDLVIIRNSLHEYNFLKFSHKKILLNKEDIYSLPLIKDFYNKVLAPKIDKGVHAKKSIVKLQLMPSVQLALFEALRFLPEKDLDQVRIMGILHHSLINIPFFDFKTITTEKEKLHRQK